MDSPTHAQQHERGSGRVSGSGSGVDTTRVLALFGYVGPVASLMTHTLFPHGHAHGHHDRGNNGSRQLQKVPSISLAAEGRSHSGHAPRLSGGGAGARTRFVLSSTEDAIDSVLPCAAERMFKRTGKFGNVGAMKFNYQA
jgi:hypothetical protein